MLKNNSKLRFGWLLALVAVGAAAAAGYWYWQIREVAGRSPEDRLVAESLAASAPGISVRIIAARRAPIQAWVFAEGTARASRREYLTFESSGRVTFVGPEKTGVAVQENEVLASLDKRSFAAEVDAALASIREAQTQVEASAADAAQAETSATLAMRQFERIEQLASQNAASAAELEEARATMENARSAVDAAVARSRALEASIAVAQAKLQQAEVNLEQADIRSPIDGIVAYLNIEEGYYFTQNFVRTTSESEALQTVPIVVIDPSQFEIIVDVPSFAAQQIQVGQKVIVLPGGTSDAVILNILEDGQQSVADMASAWQAGAEVYSVNPAINPGGRSVQVKIRTTGQVEGLRDGMFVTCWIATDENPEAVVAPLDAFLFEENRPYVFVYDPETSRVQRRDIRFGIRGLARREIVSGVAAGELLVTDGRYKLVDGAPVRALDE